MTQTFDEISRLFDTTGRKVGLLLDTGCAARAGFDYHDWAFGQQK
ncbi:MULTISPECIES: hypothetical protein [unclassified Rhizobium]|nr:MULTISPECIES: hypothetical protein [unclassified Rhizobium]MDF0661752.1 hypothetical protein [Rhizobium sp. BC49]